MPPGEDLRDFIAGLPKVLHAAEEPQQANELAKEWRGTPSPDAPATVTYRQDRVIVIEPVSNGAVLTNQEGIKEVFVFEAPCTGCSDELSGAVHMLYAIAEQMGLTGSKWDKERLTIKLEHGRGYECKLKKKDCNVCSEE